MEKQLTDAEIKKGLQALRKTHRTYFENKLWWIGVDKKSETLVHVVDKKMGIAGEPELVFYQNMASTPVGMRTSVKLFKYLDDPFGNVVVWVNCSKSLPLYVQNELVKIMKKPKFVREAIKQKNYLIR